MHPSLPFRKILLATASFLALWIPVARAQMKISLAPPPGWTLDAGSSSEQGELPTLLFKAPVERDAALFVTQAGTKQDEMSGKTTLQEVHARWFKKLNHAKPRKDDQHSFTSAHGEFWVSAFEDPKLKGKPVVRGDYKYSIQITGLVENRYIVVCTLLSQEKEGVDLEDAKAAVANISTK